MTSLFGRKIQVTIGARDIDETAIYYEDFDIKFSISRTIDGKTADTCRLTIHNINVGNIQEYLDSPKGYLRIEAGYEGNFGTIFDGDIIFSNTYQQGPNRVTEIEAGDGDKAIDEVLVKKSYAPEIKTADIIKDLVDKLKKNAGIIVDSIANGEISNIISKLDFGDVVDGKASKYLDDYLKKEGKRFTISNNTLYIYEDNINQKLIVLTPDTGLIGSPKRKRIESTGSTGKKITFGVDFQALIQPGLIPGQKIKITSSNIFEEEFTIQEINFDGETRSGSWEASGFAI